VPTENYVVPHGHISPEGFSLSNPKSEVTSVYRVGEPGQGTWLGSDGVWRFEDEISYYDSQESEYRTRLPLGVANHRQQK